MILSSTQVIIMPVLTCNSSRSTEKFTLSRLPKRNCEVSQPFVSYFVFDHRIRGTKKNKSCNGTCYLI